MLLLAVENYFIKENESNCSYYNIINYITRCLSIPPLLVHSYFSINVKAFYYSREFLIVIVRDLGNFYSHLYH